ncbi:MAG: hypothetical protein ACKVP3_05645 [Hyphomicrobiaceae bacterium]
MTSTLPPSRPEQDQDQSKIWGRRIVIGGSGAAVIFGLYLAAFPEAALEWLQSASVKIFISFCAFAIIVLGGALLYYVNVVRSPYVIVGKLTRTLALLLVMAAAGYGCSAKFPSGLNTETPGRIKVEFEGSLVDIQALLLLAALFLGAIVLWIGVWLHKDRLS